MKHHTKWVQFVKLFISTHVQWHNILTNIYNKQNITKGKSFETKLKRTSWFKMIVSQLIQTVCQCVPNLHQYIKNINMVCYPNVFLEKSFSLHPWADYIWNPHHSSGQNWISNFSNTLKASLFLFRAEDSVSDWRWSSLFHSVAEESDGVVASYQLASYLTVGARAAAEGQHTVIADRVLLERERNQSVTKHKTDI